MAGQNTDDFKTIKRRYGQLKRRLPKLVGQEVIGFAKDNFKKGGFQDGGHIRRWNRRRHQGGGKQRAVLVKGGHLKRSIRILRQGKQSVTVGSNLPYAGIHNEGGKIEQTITPKQRAFFWAKFEETDNDMWKRMALSKKLKIRIPRRQFLGNSTDLQKRLARLVRLRLLKVFR